MFGTLLPTPQGSSSKKKESIYHIFWGPFSLNWGEETGKDFKIAKLQKIIAFSSKRTILNNQKELLDDAFEQWKGELEQLDDVCIIGVRI